MANVGTRVLDFLFGEQRDAQPAPNLRMLGFSADGGLVSGVTGTTALGLSAVWRSLDILSNGCSQLEWRERRGNLDLPLSRIVQRPQAERTRREWTSLVVSTLALYDVCYLLKAGGVDTEGVPMGLWPIPPALVQPITTDYWTLTVPDSYIVGSSTVSKDELVILHRSPQPGIFDQASGLLQLARGAFAGYLAADNYASRYWQSGGPTVRALETDQTLPDPVAVQISDRWAERRAKGPDHVPVLSNGLHYKEYGVDPTSEAAVEARREMVADVGRYFGIPTALLNSPAGDSETYRSTESQGIDLVKYTIQNYIDSIQDAISDQLPGGRRMVMDKTPLLLGDSLTRAQSYQLATGGKAWMTPEDVRQEVGLAPVENPSDLNPVNPTPVAVPAGVK